MPPLPPRAWTALRAICRALPSMCGAAHCPPSQRVQLWSHCRHVLSACMRVPFLCIVRACGVGCRTNEHFIVRMLPAFVISFLGRLILNKVGKTEKVPATLVTLSSIIEERNIKQIDVLKVDVEGAEVMVLEGIQEKHWPMVQQVVLEVESFAIKNTIIDLLAAKKFETSWFASEQERNPGVHSEVCMLYAWRPEYRARHLAKSK